MAEEVVKVKYEVDAANAKVQVESLDKSMKGVKSTVESTSPAVKNFGKDVDKGLGDSLGRTGAKGANNARIAMMDFTRVVQDAPYGIRGVANNIEQLGASFTRLVATSGGGAGAMKQLIASLTGPAGIMLAISLVTTALVAFGDDIARIMGSAAGDVKKFKEAFDEIIEADFDFGKFVVKNAEDAGAAIEKLYARLAVVQGEASRKATGLFGTREVSDEETRLLGAIQRLEELRAEYFAMAEAIGTLDGSMTPVAETTSKVDREFEALLKTISSDEWDEETIENLLGEITARAERAGEEFEVLKLRKLALDEVLSTTPDVLSDSEDSALIRLINAENEAMAKQRDEFDKTRLAVVEAEQAKKKAREIALASMVATTDTEIRTAQDAARAIIASVRAIIQAKLAEAIAKSLAALGPAAPFAGAAVAAGLNLLFNNLLSGIGVYDTATSSTASGDPVSVGGSYGTGAPTTRTSIVSPLALGGMTASDSTSVLAAELRATRKAFEAKEFRLLGTDLTTASRRTQALYDAAGIRA